MAETVEMSEVCKFKYQGQEVTIYKRIGGIGEPDFAYLTSSGIYGCGMDDKDEAIATARQIIAAYRKVAKEAQRAHR